MIRELELHRKSPATVEAYVTAVSQLAEYFGRSPDQIAVEEVRDFLHYLITERQVAFSTCNQKMCGDPVLLPVRARATGFFVAGAHEAFGRLPEPLAVARWRGCWRRRARSRSGCC